MLIIVLPSFWIEFELLFIDSLNAEKIVYNWITFLKLLLSMYCNCFTDIEMQPKEVFSSYNLRIYMMYDFFVHFFFLFIVKLYTHPILNDELSPLIIYGRMKCRLS